MGFEQYNREDLMELTIASRVVSGVVVLDLFGRISHLDQSLRQTVNALLQDGHRDFVFNFTEVSYVDSFGLGQLVSIWTSIQNVSGSMRLLRPTSRVMKLLEITKLDTVFQICSDDETLSQFIESNRAATA